jgi:RHS repeat-associated protein
VVQGLSAGTYYWQVKAQTASEWIEADAGVWWSFTKVTGASGKFAPENGTAGHGANLWLAWSGVEDSGYWVCWDTTDNDTCDGNWSPNGASTSKLLQSLSPGTYYWQVMVQTGNTFVEANGGQWWQFTVGGDSTQPGSGTAIVTREYIYLGPLLLASVESGSTMTYYHTDALGSVRAVTSATGSTVSRLDYFPFGESSASLGGDPRKFIGGERDAETAFDYLGARYYRSVWGRFTSVDPVFSAGAMANPQLWNRYAYGLNGPLRFSDPTGMAASEREAPQMAEYGVTGCSPAQFLAWVAGSFAQRMKEALEQAKRDLAAGKITPEEFAKKLPVGTRDAIEKAKKQMDKTGVETGIDLGIDTRGGPVFIPWLPGQEFQAAAEYDPAAFGSPERMISVLQGVAFIAVSLHVQPLEGTPSKWDLGTDPKMTDIDVTLKKQFLAGHVVDMVVGRKDGLVYFYEFGRILGGRGVPESFIRR